MPLDAAVPPLVAHLEEPEPGALGQMREAIQGCTVCGSPRPGVPVPVSGVKYPSSSANEPTHVPVTTADS